MIKPATGCAADIVINGPINVSVLLAGTGITGPVLLTAPVLVKVKLPSAVVVILTVLFTVTIAAASTVNSKYPVAADPIDVPVPLMLIVVPVPVAATVPISVAPVKLFVLFWYNLKFVISVVAT